MNIEGIFKRKDGTYYWMDCLDEHEVKEATYFCDYDNCSGFHTCGKSALYDDMKGYIDTLQDEESLDDGSLYVVTYYHYTTERGIIHCCDGVIRKYEQMCMYQEVDFGITKQQIIENVLNQKYIEGATYYTIEQMIDSTIKHKPVWNFYQVEFGIKADGAQTGDYESGRSICIKSWTDPTFEQAEQWLASDIKMYGYDCVHSITKITEKEARSSFACEDSDNWTIFG